MPPERLMRQPPGQRPAALPRLRITYRTHPLTLWDDTAVRLQPLTDDVQPKLVETAERAQLRAFGRPLPLLSDRRAEHYTPRCTGSSGGS